LAGPLVGRRVKTGACSRDREQAPRRSRRSGS
jgi:hypothetical protein